MAPSAILAEFKGNEGGEDNKKEDSSSDSGESSDDEDKDNKDDDDKPAPKQQHAPATKPGSKAHLAYKNIASYAKQILRKQTRHFPKLAIGDYVRVSVLATDAEERKLAISHQRKSGSAVNWSKAIYRIKNIVYPKSKGGMTLPERYKLTSTETSSKELPGWFYRERLLKAVSPRDERNKAAETSNDIKKLDLEFNTKEEETEKPSVIVKEGKDGKVEEFYDIEEKRKLEKKKRLNEAQRLGIQALLEKDRNEPIAHRLTRERKPVDRYKP